jgi:hypothetical protein
MEFGKKQAYVSSFLNNHLQKWMLRNKVRLEAEDFTPKAVGGL